MCINDITEALEMFVQVLMLDLSSMAYRKGRGVSHTKKFPMPCENAAYL